MQALKYVQNKKTKALKVNFHAARKVTKMLCKNMKDNKKDSK